MSRTTIREALRHLQAQDLLTARGRTSPLEAASPDAAAAHFRESLTRAVQLRDVSLTDLLELRVAVETAALARAAAAPVETRLAEARVALGVMERPDVFWQEFFPADVAFHAALVAASGNHALVLVMLAAKDSIALQLEETMRARGLLSRSSVLVRARAGARHGS